MVDFTYYKSKKEILRKLPEELLPYLKYWNACSKIESLGVPCNTAISPVIFKNHLPWVKLVTVDENGVATIKLHGTGLAHIYGDQTGLTVTETSLPEAMKSNLTDMIKSAIDNVAPVYQEGLNLVRDSSLLTNVRLLTLPFSKRGTDIDHILFISHSDYPEAREKPPY